MIHSNLDDSIILEGIEDDTDSEVDEFVLSVNDLFDRNKELEDNNKLTEDNKKKLQGKIYVLEIEVDVLKQRCVWLNDRHTTDQGTIIVLGVGILIPFILSHLQFN